VAINDIRSKCLCCVRLLAETRNRRIITVMCIRQITSLQQCGDWVRFMSRAATNHFNFWSSCPVIFGLCELANGRFCCSLGLAGYRLQPLQCYCQLPTSMWLYLTVAALLMRCGQRQNKYSRDVWQMLFTSVALLLQKPAAYQWHCSNAAAIQ